MEFDVLEGIVLTRVKSEFSDKIKKKYPDLTFTTTQKSDQIPKFPTVYIHLLPSPERGQDLSGNSINGIYANFQIEVSDNQNNSRAREVMNEVVRIMKTMRFSINEMPYSDYRDNTYYSLVRARRMIGSNDIL